MKTLFSIILALQLIAIPMISSAATTRYVSEELEITMRSGQGVKFGITQMLKSGTSLSVIEKNSTSGYSRIRTENGKEGWVLTRYLSNNPSSRNQAIASAEKVANLELEIAKYKEEFQSLSAQNTSSGTENTSLKETSQRLSKELDNLRRTASNAVAIDNENRQLKEKLRQIDHDMQAVLIENSALKNSDTKRWFLIGAAVLFGGLLLGLIIPRLRFNKKESW